MISTFTYFIFDYDGVVVNSEPVFAQFDCELINACLTKAGHSHKFTPADIRKLAGMGSQEKLLNAGKIAGIDMRPYTEQYLKARNEKRKTLFIENKIPLGKNLRQFINHVGKERCALATNKTGPKLETDMKIMGIADLFDITITTDPLPRKPAPDIIIKAMEQLNATPDQCVYIGDNKNDMIAAKAAEIKPIGFSINGLDKETEQAKLLKDHGALTVIDDHMDLTAYIK
ncbi:MAG: HAD family hydrolase [Alphaproteobacteria bacterium]